VRYGGGVLGEGRQTKCERDKKQAGHHFPKVG